MSGRVFIDTNIFIYSFGDDTAKEAVSDKILSAYYGSENGVISFQVVQEFCNAALRKFKKPFSNDELKDYCNETLYPFCKIFPSFELLDTALSFHKKHKISYYDSLIVAAANMAGCNYLLSEDMNDGQIIERVTVFNPFKNTGRLEEILQGV